MLKKVLIFCDGSSLGNPGPGGYGTIIKYGEKTLEISGGENPTTNNRMELTGAIEGLKRLKEPCNVTIYSDSKYLVDGITKGWARGWKAKGWVKSDKKPALNVDLWEPLLSLLDIHTVDFIWIKGHSGHPQNERCDQLAVEYATKLKNL